MSSSVALLRRGSGVFFTPPVVGHGTDDTENTEMNWRGFYPAGRRTRHIDHTEHIGRSALLRVHQLDLRAHSELLNPDILLS